MLIFASLSTIGPGEKRAVRNIHYEDRLFVPPIRAALCGAFSEEFHLTDSSAHALHKRIHCKWTLVSLLQIGKLMVWKVRVGKGEELYHAVPGVETRECDDSFHRHWLLGLRAKPVWNNQL